MRLYLLVDRDLLDAEIRALSAENIFDKRYLDGVVFDSPLK